ncbi:1,6-anhydro-N-acetylmuramyl-L-alanine amidase AmpD [Agaribacterium sp. ZY112]|uniref:1,6-anhydro-N-acetylmuramyl-L-alanine amidase AmpD n=1 Tax=Agaribacterium sp. ZY112 TaxID=3233574 RepID=UPI003526A4CE
MYSLDSGWLTPAEQLASPNFNQRPEGAVVSLLVVHCISLPPNEFGGPWIRDFFCNSLDCSAHPYFQKISELQVSSHFFIERSGHIVQFVATGDRAWHAGQSSFDGVADCNNYSIGIELEGCETKPYTDEQYLALSKLSRCLMSYYSDISPERICGHSDIAPGRKTDPGPLFDWSYFRQLLANNE